MTVEPLRYRARKWVVQQVTENFVRSDQHQRLAETDWDITVILDACRWDTLQNIADWPIDSARSPGSATPQWLTAAEKTRIFEDSFIITANAQYKSVDLGEHQLYPVWESDWNARLGTVLPKPVLRGADELLSDGDRPVVAHLLPPHAPYVGKVGDTWLPAFPETDIWNRNPNVEQEEGKLSPQVAMARGHIDLNRAVESYKASVASVWGELVNYVERWVADDHTVVVTADHGETFGRIQDWGFCGHPNRCHIDPLVKVPFETFERPTDVEGATTVDEKLRALGYVE